MRDQSLADLEFSPFTMPGGEPVQLARLSREGPFSVLVRFPEGWRRAVTGSYPVDETVVVLEGEITVSGVTVSAGGVMWVPPGTARVDSRSGPGALTFARFSGPPAWQEGEGDERPPLTAVPGNTEDSPLGAPGGRLELNGGPEVWLHQRLDPVRAPRHLELLAPDDGLWARAEAGEQLPAATGRCWAILPA